MTAEQPESSPLASPGDAGYAVVTVYSPNAFQDRRPPIVNVYGPFTKPAANAQVKRFKRERQARINAHEATGVIYFRVRPILRDDMFGTVE